MTAEETIVEMERILIHASSKVLNPIQTRQQLLDLITDYKAAKK